MNTQQEKILMHTAGIENEAIRKVVEEQANFYIDGHYDYLRRRELDASGAIPITQERKTDLRQQAINSYMASNENFLRDMKASEA